MATFLLEVRTEEIPANALAGARRQLRDGFEKRLTDSGFPAFKTTVYSTPLRLIVSIDDLPLKQADRVEEMTGPPVRIAVAEDGTPTKAGLGFASKTGLPFESLRRVKTDKGEYLGATVKHKGRNTLDILGEMIPDLLAGLRFPKMMRWGLGEHLFVRPVHSIVALLDRDIVPFETLGVTSGRTTVGHRVHHPEPITVDQAGDYARLMARDAVMIDPAERRQTLEIAAQHLASTVGCEVHHDPRLVGEHVELVEWPGLILGHFPPEYLELPPEVVVQTLRHHQKCLILEFGDGTLQPHFLAVIDRKDDPQELIRTGNEWVIGARLADAEFFFSEDRKEPLESGIASLERVEWHRVLGSLEAKAERIGRLAVTLNERLDLGESTETLCRAARLVKVDLTTHMVGEFPELQGVMGGHYLRLEGADDSLWTASRDHYRPTGFDGPVPESALGKLLGVADRLDTIAGLFAVGEKPTGSRDPLALRRAAQAVVKIIVESGWSLDPVDALGRALESITEFATEDTDATKAALKQFMSDRFRRWLTDQSGVAGDTADAVMAAGWADPPEASARAQALEDIRSDETFRALALAFKRVRNITEGHAETDVDPKQFEHEAETELFESIGRFHESLETLLPEHRIHDAFGAMIPIAETLDRFFVDVLVMAEDPGVRSNRIALLNRLGRDFLTLADLSILQIDGGES